jgi:hypothetical protein
VHRALAINRDAFASGQHTALRAAGVPGALTSTGSDAGRPSLEADALPFPATEADEKALADLDERVEADKETLLRCAHPQRAACAAAGLHADGCSIDRCGIAEPATKPAAARTAGPAAAVDADVCARRSVCVYLVPSCSWSLDAWTLSDAEVQSLCCAMLHSMGLLRRFSIQPTQLAALVSDVAARYNANPFHSFRHAASVMARCWLFLNTSASLRRQLTELDHLALLLAALCHDIEVRPSCALAHSHIRAGGACSHTTHTCLSRPLTTRPSLSLQHPGTTNSFHVATRSPLAQRYNDTSVLENHHCCAGFAALERSGVLGGLPSPCLKAFRKHFVAAVLATDMAMHKARGAGQHAAGLDA